MATLKNKIHLTGDPTGEKWESLVEKKREQLDRKFNIFCFG